MRRLGPLGRARLKLAAVALSVAAPPLALVIIVVGERRPFWVIAVGSAAFILSAAGQMLLHF